MISGGVLGLFYSNLARQDQTIVPPRRCVSVGGRQQLIIYYETCMFESCVTVHVVKLRVLLFWL